VRLHLIFDDPARRINGFIHKCRHGITSCALGVNSLLRRVHYRQDARGALGKKAEEWEIPFCEAF
ncbi:MAG: hypothetical protein M3Y13_09420, partial [Armatimonadota bacterium]|nr:hypothetical protein [Armatimonadota bacterium]